MIKSISKYSTLFYQSILFCSLNFTLKPKKKSFCTYLTTREYFMLLRTTLPLPHQKRQFVRFDCNGTFVLRVERKIRVHVIVCCRIVLVIVSAYLHMSFRVACVFVCKYKNIFEGKRVNGMREAKAFAHESMMKNNANIDKPLFKPHYAINKIA